MAKNKSCCAPKGNAVKQGILYGLVPHIGCIMFLAGTILGVSFLTSLFRPLLMNAWFFPALIVLSIGLTTISAALYLKRANALSFDGAMANWKYLATMYGLTIVINYAMVAVIFPAVAVSRPVLVVPPATTGPATAFFSFTAALPCPGHAPLVGDDVSAVQGVRLVKFSLPDRFTVGYDPDTTNQSVILGLPVFKEFPATVIN